MWSRWVDPVDGVDEGNLSGSIDEPFSTIDYALSLVYSPDDDNPVTIHFKEAGISLIVNGTLEKKSVDLSPGLNRVEFDVSPMDRGETFQMYIDLDKIYQR